MRTVFGHWVYIVKNLWFVLPFAVMPAFFLALCVNFSAIEQVSYALFHGALSLRFIDIFRAWSFIRIDSVLGAVYSVCNILCLIFFTAILLGFVEKHMRIGKRTFSGVFSQLGNHLFEIAGVLLFYIALYELWALVLSAVLYAICAIPSKAFAAVMFLFATLMFAFALIYLISVFYLWLPCLQITGFRVYNAFLYSYRLVVGVRWKLILSLAISMIPLALLLVGCAFMPHLLAGSLAFVFYAFLYLSFFIRMETLYFETDKLDREDLLRSYREL